MSSFVDLTAFASRVSQQVNGGASRIGNWTRTKAQALRRRDTKNTNGERRKRESKQKSAEALKFINRSERWQQQPKKKKEKQNNNFY